MTHPLGQGGREGGISSVYVISSIVKEKGGEERCPRNGDITSMLPSKGNDTSDRIFSESGGGSVQDGFHGEMAELRRLITLLDGIKLWWFSLVPG